MVDTHSHLYADEFVEDLELVLERSQIAGISKVYLPAIDSHSHTQMMNLADKYPDFCLPMMGLHPCYINEQYETELTIVRTWLDKRPFAAIGEIGLDFYHSVEFKTEQERAFQIQIEWALEKELPIVIHSRSSMDECIKMVAQHGKGKVKGIFHCFGGDERVLSLIRTLDLQQLWSKHLWSIWFWKLMRLIYHQFLTGVKEMRVAIWFILPIRLLN